MHVAAKHQEDFEADTGYESNLSDQITGNVNDADNFFAWNPKDSGLWCFGAVYTHDSGVVFVLDPTTNARECINRTCAVAEPLQECVMVTGNLTHINVFLKHTEELLTRCGSREQEVEAFKSVLGMYEPLLKHVTLQNTVASDSKPVPGKYPANITSEARSVWDKVLESNKYHSLCLGKSGLACWSIASKLFMDKCHRNNITPFQKRGGKFVDELGVKYSGQRNLAALLERQTLYNLEANGLVTDFSRGTWKFLKTDYIDNRYAIVLETNWMSSTKSPGLIARHLTGEEHFTKSASGGWEHNVSHVCRIIVRIKRYPEISVRMVLLFSRDMLTGLGIGGRNRTERLELFKDIASYWARHRKFKKLRAV